MAQPNAHLSPILTALREGKTLTSDQWQQLAAWELEDERRASAFGIAAENVQEVVKERSHLFQSVCSHLWQSEGREQKKPSLPLQNSSFFLENLWSLWLPLAMQVVSYRQALERPLIQGILGVQGTGKTTLAAILTLILNHLKYRTTSLSLDDLYKTHAERQALREQDPRLVWRGPPGTHDINLGIAVLDQLRQKEPKRQIQVPRFDKSAWEGAGDRTQAGIVEDVDIVLFEGWFVGVRPIDPATFTAAPPPIVTEADRSFACDMNTQLKNYLPLWERLDRLILLYPVDYRSSLVWRQQAERQMIASGSSGMTDLMIEQFVEYFWRSLHPELFIKSLTKNPDLVDLVIEIHPDRSVGAVYQPSS